MTEQEKRANGSLFLPKILVTVILISAILVALRLMNVL